MLGICYERDTNVSPVKWRGMASTCRAVADPRVSRDDRGPDRLLAAVGKGRLAKDERDHRWHRDEAENQEHRPYAKAQANG